MAQIKSYTDLEQSKKLAEILPLESADMYYECTKEEPEYKVYVGRNIAITYNLFSYRNGHTIPCWSLATLLSVLPDSIYDNTDEFSQLEFTKKSVAYIQGATNGVKIGTLKDNLVDACVDMIIKLNELNLL